MKVKCTDSNLKCFTVGNEYETRQGEQAYPFYVNSDDETEREYGWGLDSDLIIRTLNGAVIASFELPEGLANGLD